MIGLLILFVFLAFLIGMTIYNLICCKEINLCVSKEVAMLNKKIAGIITRINNKESALKLDLRIKKEEEKKQQIIDRMIKKTQTQTQANEKGSKRYWEKEAERCRKEFINRISGVKQK